MESKEFKRTMEEFFSRMSKPLTVDEACEYLRCSKSYLYKLTHRKLIKCYKPTGKKLFFKEADLQNFLLQNPICEGE